MRDPLAVLSGPPSPIVRRGSATRRRVPIGTHKPSLAFDADADALEALPSAPTCGPFVHCGGGMRQSPSRNRACRERNTTAPALAQVLPFLGSVHSTLAVLVAE